MIAPQPAESHHKNQAVDKSSLPNDDDDEAQEKQNKNYLLCLVQKERQGVLSSCDNNSSLSKAIKDMRQENELKKISANSSNPPPDLHLLNTIHPPSSQAPSTSIHLQPTASDNNLTDLFCTIQSQDSTRIQEGFNTSCKILAQHNDDQNDELTQPLPKRSRGAAGNNRGGGKKRGDAVNKEENVIGKRKITGRERNPVLRYSPNKENNKELFQVINK